MIRHSVPKTTEDLKIPNAHRQIPVDPKGYVREYNKGWASARRPSDSGAFNGGSSSDSFDDGYLDYATGREKWHLTYCEIHDLSGAEGCGQA